MQTWLTRPGFLGTNATLRTDLTLMLVVISSLLMITGWRLAVNKRFKTHRQVETIAVMINAIAVLGTMVSSFIINILPGLPSKFLQGSYGFTTLHAAIGLAGMLLGGFVVLRGYKLVPKKFRFKNYKLWMRTSLILYLAGTLSGIFLYVVVFIYGM